MRPMREKNEKLEPKDRVILALDVSTAEAALRLVEETGGLVGMYKIGSQLFTAAGPDLVRTLLQRGERVFLDLKFHDIPTTVARAGIEATRLGVSMFTVHALGGEPMMRAVVEAVADFCARESIAQPRILAVTVLTSLGAEDLVKVGLRDEPEQIAIALARLAHACGVGGVVASAWEVARIREVVPHREFAIVVPGIRPAGASAHDQRRSATPQEAIRAGADYLVLGRPVFESACPREVLEDILRELSLGAFG
ncbi:MAG: orotidine-5'-phosphate decarboxylase [Blastocatellia bacterium]|nr:orotidine-5'-phosphate decarboxylase [Blastocatellia bacterium]MCS7157724.1 orotidine-5'-phosphate decarboxylase [Blastocatellia bacterium]MCX7751989.1 orotidine-5'-phosphate decarboxylase [Blastocatellia bacterium]MDW8167095.1 orotidine-5'-phosphate decarboxylase [Acidobacteriota bacterium]MDW8257199.1 orotidine-5'-phosphate decarboxylase [Acidobacteriota bacterium]